MKYRYEPRSLEKERIRLLNQLYDRPKIDELVKRYEALGPFRFTGLLSFQMVVSEQVALRNLALHWRRVQKKALGTRWNIKGVGPMSGIAVMELASIDPRGNSSAINPHFHYLINDHPSLPREDTKATKLLDKAFKSASTVIRTDGDKPKSLVASDGSGVCFIDEGFLIYLAKQAGDPEWNWSSRVKVLCPDGYV